MIKQLKGCFDEPLPEWSEFKHVYWMVSHTSTTSVPRKVVDLCQKNKNKIWFGQKHPSEIDRVWIILNNSEVKFAESNSSENVWDTPRMVSEEMFEFFSDKWFCTVNDCYVFDDGQLFSLNMVQNYLVDVMRNTPDISRLVVDELKASVPVCARAWALFFILNHKEKLSKILRDVGTIKQLITLETIL